jgi:Arc/MetJ family transcription regulator
MLPGATVCYIDVIYPDQHHHYPIAAVGTMTITQVDLDDEALDRVMATSGAKTKKDAVNLALRFYAARQERASVIAKHFDRAREWGAVADAARRHDAEKNAL